MRSDYTILGVKDGIIFIEDMNIGGKSVTNDAEKVIKDLVALFGDKRVIYKDSDGLWCELHHKNGIFTSFGENHASSGWETAS